MTATEILEMRRLWLEGKAAHERDNPGVVAFTPITPLYSQIIGAIGIGMYAMICADLKGHELDGDTHNVYTTTYWASRLSVNRQTAEKYLRILESCHLIERVPVLLRSREGKEYTQGYITNLTCPDEWVEPEIGANGEYIFPVRENIPIELRIAIYERDGYACVNCGATDHLSVDHILPVALGGLNEYGNLQTLCLPCNQKKGARI